MKISRTQYGLEEEIIEALYALRDKKSSDIFKEPVDATKIPDYYEKIKNPIDLSTIQKKLKQSKYRYPQEVHKDLQLIVENCKLYNTYNPNIIKKAEQFQQCIKTVWGNFKKQIDKKGISYNRRLDISEEILKRIGFIEEKKSKRKNPNLLMTIQQEKKNILPTVSVLPPLENDVEKNDKDELPQHLQFRREKYLMMSNEEKRRLAYLYYQEQPLKNEFERLAIKKLAKYKKILKKRLMWFDEKIIKKCLQKKRFKKMLVPNHLAMFADSGSIASQLNIRKLQLYVKQITYWVEDNSNILNDYMKDRFVQNCKWTKKCILRVIKYKKIPKIRSILDNAIYGTQLLIDERFQNDREEDNYDNRMKEFKRMLDRDRAESTKRDTKIILRNQNGELQVIDWTSDKKQERNRKEGGGGLSRIEAPDNDERRKQEQRKREEIRKDEQFIEEYSKKSNVLLVGKYGDQLKINWDVVSFPNIELPKQFNFNYTDDDL